jgi:hypothetical protein
MRPPATECRGLVDGSFEDLFGVGAWRACLGRVIRCDSPGGDEEFGRRFGQFTRRYLQQTCKKLTLTQNRAQGVLDMATRRRRFGLIWRVCLNVNWIALACCFTLGRYESEGQKPLGRAFMRLHGQLSSWSHSLFVPPTSRIDQMAFSSPVTKVKAGTEVVWKINDSSIHAVTADDGSFSSPALDQGAVFKKVFTKPGTYSFTCEMHPFMSGKVVVE